MSRGNGDSWRWDIEEHPRPSTHSIDVIEQPRGHERPVGERAVPFGFGPREDEPPTRHDEWLGNPS